MKKSFLAIFLILFSMIIFCTHVNASDDSVNLSETNTFNYDYSHKDNESHYNLNKRNNNTIDEDTLLTVLTPGLGGTVNHFANFKTSEETFSKVEDNDNIVNIISSTYNNKVNIFYGYVSENKPNIMNVTEYFFDDYVENNAYHNILLFEIEEAHSSNEYTYDLFDKTVSKVVLNIKKENDDILPKINLIGHSRGGIINLLYALDHPDMINQIFSIGTPYVGSSTAKIDVELNDCGIGSGEGAKEEDKQGEKDIVNSELYTSYMNRWNDNYNNLYSEIKVYTLGGVTAYNALADFLLDSETAKYVSQSLNISRAIYYPIAFLLSDKIRNLSLRSVMNPFVDKNGWDIKSKSAFLSIGVIDTKKAELVYSLLRTIINETEYKGIKKRLVWMNDGLVDISSQLGTGYTGFINYTKIFTSFNCNTKKCATTEMPSVVHNLEVRDKTFLNYIGKNIVCDSKGQNIIKPKYITYELDNNSVGIYSYLGSDSVVDIPSTINNKEVVEIIEGAFTSNDDVEIINIPNTIKSIKDYSFCECSNLTDINISGNISDIAYSTAFNECEKLSNINVDSTNYKNINGILYNGDYTSLYLYPEGKSDLNFVVPDSTTNISSYAFLNSCIESIDLNNVIDIEPNAFSECANLSNIVGDNILYVGPNALRDTKWYNESQSKMLTLGKSLLKYNSSDTIISCADLSDINQISSNAFNDYDNITIYIPASLKIISSNAFNNIKNLNIYVSSEYDNISTICDTSTNVVFNCDRDLKDYYINKVDYNINVFDGIEKDKAYTTIIFESIVEDNNLYVKDTKYNIYEGDILYISDINYKDDGGYSIYYLDGLYYDNKGTNKYELDYIVRNDINLLYARWAYCSYTIIYDYNLGKSLNNNTIENAYYNYYSNVELLDGFLKYTNGILYWKSENGKRYNIGEEYNIINFLTEIDKEERTLKLYAEWDYTNYKITYYYNGFNNRYDKEEDTYNFYELKKLNMINVGNYVLIGWYNRDIVDENEIGYSYEYITEFKELYHSNIELYAKYYINGHITINKTYKITDSGRYRQSYDDINMFEVLKISIDELKELGYKEVKIKVSISVEEIDKGNQYVFLYKTVYNNASDLITSYEITDASKDQSIKDITFTVNLDDFKSDILFIRFGASGSFDDDWVTEFRTYSFEVVK